MKLHPFVAVRPPKEHAARVASPPYDVIDTAEARALAEGNEASFLHVIRPEIDLPEGTDVHADEVYAEARKQLDRLMSEGYLQADSGPALWAYRQEWRGHVQTGVVGAAEVLDYLQERIKKHEFTRPDKEDDRTRHVDATDANAGPVFLACRQSDALSAALATATAGEPYVEFVGYADVTHRLWRVSSDEALSALAGAFAPMDAFYIADGHHRAASAARVQAQRLAAQPTAGEDAAWRRFLVVVFPQDQLQILAYNRLVLDMAGHTSASLLNAVGQNFDVSPPGAAPVPTEPHTFSMYFDGQWRTLTARPHLLANADAVARLDVALLQDHLLEPVLNIDDPRTNTRIQFVGGIRGTDELQKRADAAGGVAFSMVPTQLSELFDVADMGRVMPPKSTWFEPKLASGLLIHRLS